MKHKRTIFIIAGAIIFLTNVPPFTFLLRTFVDEGHYRYSNYNGSYTSYEFMSRDFAMMKRNHRMCLKYQPELKDKKIYRLFSKNPFAFWRWGLYFFDERYKLPYKNWEDVKKKRTEENVKRRTGCPMEY
ncbi:MAG: hypothetical protein ACQUHE_11720 [Bacteroidia bacterium]